MERRLFELCGKDPAIRFSPYVWRIRFALCRKELPFTAETVRYSDKRAIAPSGSKTVPVLNDGGKWVADSWRIAKYLEETYPDQPSLFAGDEAFALFVQNWANSTLLPALFMLTCSDILEQFEGEDRDYFYKTRSERIGMPLEKTLKLRDRNLKRLKNVLAPVRETLKQQDFISGGEPLYPDYIVFGAFQWVKLVSPLDVLRDEPEISRWFSRVWDFYKRTIPDLEPEPLV